MWFAETQSVSFPFCKFSRNPSLALRANGSGLVFVSKSVVPCWRFGLTRVGFSSLPRSASEGFHAISKSLSWWHWT